MIANTMLYHMKDTDSWPTTPNWKKDDLLDRYNITADRIENWYKDIINIINNKNIINILHGYKLLIP